MNWRINRRGMAQLQDELSRGLEAVADKVLIEAQNRAPVGTRDPFGETKATLHTEKSHSREWPKPAVFVSTANGYGFFVHEGTVDTPAQPFLSPALDSVRREIPTIMAKSRGGLLRRLFT